MAGEAQHKTPATETFREAPKKISLKFSEFPRGQESPNPAPGVRSQRQALENSLTPSSSAGDHHLQGAEQDPIEALEQE